MLTRETASKKSLGDIVTRIYPIQHESHCKCRDLLRVSNYVMLTFDGVSGNEVQLVPSPPLLSSSGDADAGESGGVESSLRFRGT